MGDCNTCPLYQAAEKFALTSCLRSTPKWKIAPSEWGKTAQAAMVKRGIKTYEELGALVDYSGNTVNNVILGNKPTVGRVARAISKALGIAPPSDSDAPALPGIGEGAAA
jgi:hypothetical protein